MNAPVEASLLTSLSESLFYAIALGLAVYIAAWVLYILQPLVARREIDLTIDRCPRTWHIFLASTMVLSAVGYVFLRYASADFFHENLVQIYRISDVFDYVSHMNEVPSPFNAIAYSTRFIWVDVRLFVITLAFATPACYYLLSKFSFFSNSIND
ncbi:MAG: hypothetical protein EBR02_01790 [Alphaproteobacteria bacterium]|nr:hypothetical protein [Alphaproteobacteria bacterium]